MAINKTTTETKNKIKANSVIALPNRPQIPAEQLKQAFVKPIVDTSNSMIQELDRIVEETNAELEQVQVDITDAIDEHNTNTEATHLDIRQEITDLENDLQGQIDVIDDTLQNHVSRIGELELFAANLETNITEEIEGALDNKADLVDGKVPLEQLPDVEEVLTGDITSHNHTTEIGNHNASELAHPFLKGKIDEAKAIAEGKSRAIVFATEADLEGWLATPPTFTRPDGKTKDDLKIGDNFYIEETDKPDYWWNGTTIKELETQKVDLTEYAKKTELLTLGTTENDAYRGDLGQIAYNHSQEAHAPSNAEQNVQSDWNQADDTQDDYIKNKPTIPTKTSDLDNDDNFIDNSYDNSTSGLTATTINGAIDELKSEIDGIETEITQSNSIPTTLVANQSYYGTLSANLTIATLTALASGKLSQWHFVAINGASAYEVDFTPTILWETELPTFATSTIYEFIIEKIGDTYIGKWYDYTIPPSGYTVHFYSSSSGGPCAYPYYSLDNGSTWEQIEELWDETNGFHIDTTINNVTQIKLKIVDDYAMNLKIVNETTSTTLASGNSTITTNNITLSENTTFSFDWMED